MRERSISAHVVNGELLSVLRFFVGPVGQVGQALIMQSKRWVRLAIDVVGRLGQRDGP